MKTNSRWASTRVAERQVVYRVYQGTKVIWMKVVPITGRNYRDRQAAGREQEKICRKGL